MPVIDLKNVSVYFEDGTLKAGAINNAKTGAINHMAGYSSGVTSVTVDGFTGVVPVGSALTLNSVPGFRVTSTVESAGDTVTINFTPATTGALTDDDVVSVNGFAIGATILKVDGFSTAPPVGARLSIGSNDSYVVTAASTTQLTISPALVAIAADNVVVTIYGVFIDIKVGEGTITWSEKKPREYKLDRGRLDSVRNGDEVPIDVSINLMYEAVTASMGDPPTPEDALKQRGQAASWLSTETADPCAPYCINIRLDHLPPNCVGFDKERVILPFFRYEELAHDPKAGTINCTGKCNALEAIVTRIAA